jgi:NADH:ubiquinone oxidoreductase subunit K
MMEVVLSQHYFRLVQASLYLFLLHSRIFFVILYELAAADAAVPLHAIPLKQMLLEIIQTQRFLYQVVDC